ncbi:hypothetical protein JCM10207_005338 [Rhodosporidiobolus poonsookiae]
MGYVATFCQISGCSPTAAEDLKQDFRILEPLEELEKKGAEHVDELRSAVQQLGEDEGKKLEVTVIGPIRSDGSLRYPEEGDFNDRTEAILAEISDELRLVPHCRNGQWYEFGSVSTVDEKLDFLISYGPCFFVMSAALPILFLATDGRMNLQRLWQLAMKQGRCERSNDYVLTDGVDYGAVEQGMDQFLSPLPSFVGMDPTETEPSIRQYLKQASTANEFKELLVHEGGFWVWMAPDDFPLNPSLTPPPPPAVLDSPSGASPSSAKGLEKLPLDVLLLIASTLPLPSLLALSSASRTLRHTLLGTPTSRSRLASAWLTSTGRYWQPVRVDLGVDFSSSLLVEEKTVRLGKVEVLPLAEGDDWWAYLQRCAGSGSMRNRRRIWHTVGTIEKVADEAGV